MEDEISLIEMLTILKKRTVFIINSIFIGLALAALYTFFIATPQFSSSTQLLVNRTQETEIIQRSDIDTNVQLINTYSDIINNSIILDPVIASLNLNQSADQLKGKINVTAAENSQVFTLQITDDNPYEAAEIANEISTIFKEDLNSIMNVDNVTIISEATVSSNPISPNNTLNLIIGLVLGAFVGIGSAFLLDFFDTSVKSSNFIVDTLGWTNLGTISKMSPEDLKSISNASTTRNRKEDSRTTRSRV